MAMSVIAFDDLKRPVETSSSVYYYCSSHPPLALSENVEFRRYNANATPLLDRQLLGLSAAYGDHRALPNGRPRS